MRFETDSMDHVLGQLRSLPQVRGLTESSLNVEAGDVFVACAQNEDARLQHMEAAAQAGAVAFVIDAQAQHVANLSLPTFQMDQLARQR